MSTTDLMTMDDALARELLGMVDKNDTAGASVPILKMNYTGIDDGGTYPKGTWIVGQQKDKEGNVTDQGKGVKAMVILTTRNRYSCYNKKDTSGNCSSKFHNMGEQVRGSKYHNVCGSGCAYRAKDLNPRCKAQKVVFAVALCDDGSAVECMTYIQGETYVPFLDYYKMLTRKKVKAGFVDIPPFCHATLLGSEKKKYDATTYFVGQFSLGPMFDMEQIKGFESKRGNAQAMIDRINAIYGEGSEGEHHEPARHTDDDIPFDLGTPKATTVEAEFIPAKPKAAEAMTVPVKTPAPVAVADDDDFDIESAIRNALKAA